MRTRVLILAAAVVLSGAGFVLGHTSAKASPDQGEAGKAPVNCSIPRANGTLKGIAKQQATFAPVLMVFEDSAGTIRVINPQCGVEYKFSRN